MQPALGLLETTGLAASVQVVDAMVKAAPVRLLGRWQVGGGLVTVAVSGDVASVHLAVEAGRAAVPAGTDVTTSVLGRPGPGVLELLTGGG